MQSRFRAGGLDLVDVACAVDARDLLVRCRRGGVVLEMAVEPGGDQPVGNGVEPLRAFRMVRPHVVLAAGRVREERGGHGT